MFAFAASAAGLHAQSSSDILGAARDLVYQALEQLSPHATPADVTRAVRFLRVALDQYPSLGDAHYYRFLCLQRLNQEPALQKSALAAAQRYQSEALRDKRDPFFLAVPKMEALAKVGQKWALVVGISQFHPDKGVDRLQAAAADAESFASLLKDPDVGRFPPNQVFLLTNEKAPTAAIKSRLNTIATRAKPEDVVTVYISTHGSARSDDLRQVSYLYTYDTDASTRDEVFGTALAMVDVSGIISERCLAQRTVVIFDTCHSGAGFSPKALSMENIDRLREGAGRYVMSSCDENQLAYEDSGHGYFTDSLIARLRERRGCIRMKDLFTQVRQDVSTRVQKRYGKQQQPVMISSDSAAEVMLGTAVGGASEGCAA